MSKILQTRVQNKHDIKANWDKATNFIPLAGEIIIYDDLNQIKMGDGQTYLSELPFLDGKIKTINNVEPDENGNIEITAEQVGALPLSGGQMDSDSSISWESDDFFMEVGNPDDTQRGAALSTYKMNYDDGTMHVAIVTPNTIAVGRAGYNYEDTITITNEGITSTDVYEHGEIGLSRIIDDERNGEKLKLGAFELTHTTVKDSNNADIVAGSVGDAIISGVHAPLADDHAVNKKYVDEAVASGGSVKTVNGLEPDENGNIEVTIDNVEIPVFSVVGTTLVISNAIQQAEGASY